MGLLSGHSARKAADEYSNTMKSIAQGYGTLGKAQYGAISPWMDAGTQALSAQLQMLANPINQQQALSDFYASPQYDQQQQAAQYAMDAQAEATGGLGNTATSNALAAQTTSMGQNYLNSLGKQRQQQFTNLGGLSKQGLNATDTMGNWAQQGYNSAANYLGNAASAQVSGKGQQAKGRNQFMGNALGLASYGLMFL
jgi:hypothetical protein